MNNIRRLELFTMTEQLQHRRLYNQLVSLEAMKLLCREQAYLSLAVDSNGGTSYKFLLKL